jgi:uncharacterized protein involved in outer membrane biogenesis
MSPERGGVGLKLLVFLAVVFAAGALAWMLFLPLVFTTQVRQRTGFDITVQSLAVNPFTGTIELRGLVLANPPTFPVRDFVELRRFSAEVEVLTLFSARPVLATMALDVAKVTLVKRPAAETNAESFQRHLTQADDPPLPLPARPARGFLIRRLEVRIDELVIADYSARIPAVQRYKLAFNQTYMDVTSVQGLLPVGTALNGLLPGALGQALGEVVKEATKSGAGLLKDAGRKAGEKIKGYFDALEESRKP